MLSTKSETFLLLWSRIAHLIETCSTYFNINMWLHLLLTIFLWRDSNLQSEVKKQTDLFFFSCFQLVGSVRGVDFLKKKNIEQIFQHKWIRRLFFFCRDQACIHDKFMLIYIDTDNMEHFITVSDLFQAIGLQRNKRIGCHFIIVCSKENCILTWVT